MRMLRHLYVMAMVLAVPVFSVMVGETVQSLRVANHCEPLGDA
ncbi:hypothetical protein [Microtetraspora sp. AC03309]|nr:hypothetical protein [Microtetraspora sp. AC03309]